MTFTRDNVRQDDGPPRKRNQCMPLWTPGPGMSGQLLICCPSYETLITHWDGARNTLCRVDGCICEDPSRRVSSRTRAYFGCWDMKARKYVIGVVTHGAWESFHALASPLQGSLEGLLLCMSRPGPGRQGRVVASLEHPRQALTEMPIAFDLWGQLMLVFNAPLRARRNGG